ncbi:MAG TPA: copper chaperone PCu(A)C [Micromonosporaceae bacterium]|nr:copper chaperone PCu(A)C [Micromonosporaceae bacterium]
MTRSIRGARRAAALLAAAAATIMVLPACSTGQISETANKSPGVSGFNTQLRTPKGVYKIRNLQVAYAGIEGYPAGGDAPLEVAIFNETNDPVTVTITTDSARALVLPSTETTPGQPAESPEGDETTEPAPTGEPATFRIPPHGFVTFSPTTRQLQLLGLHKALKSGQTVDLTFDFDGQQLKALAPVTVPLTPVPTASPEA